MRLILAGLSYVVVVADVSGFHHSRDGLRRSIKQSAERVQNGREGLFIDRYELGAVDGRVMIKFY